MLFYLYPVNLEITNCFSEFLNIFMIITINRTTSSLTTFHISHRVAYFVELSHTPPQHVALDNVCVHKIVLKEYMYWKIWTGKPNTTIICKGILGHPNRRICIRKYSFMIKKSLPINQYFLHDYYKFFFTLFRKVFFFDRFSGNIIFIYLNWICQFLLFSLLFPPTCIQNTGL